MRFHSYHEVLTDRDAELGRKIYAEALASRRGFRDDQINIPSDDEIWIEIFRHIATVARRVIAEEPPL